MSGDVKWGDVPKVFVGLPHAGKLDAESLESARTCCTKTNIDPALIVQPVGFMRANSGGLTLSFNMILARAMTMRDRGECTHLAMIHSDIEAQGPWVNALWNEMRRYRLGVVSAVVAIKDKTKRNTSTAIGTTGDPWKIARYVYLADRETTPDTFTSEDVCKPGEELLINTGVMLADLRNPFWDGYAFEVRNKVVKEGDSYVDYFESEDWKMSRDLNRAGVRYGATWLVPTRHLGGGSFANYED
jgi:hypothetical protein